MIGWDEHSPQANDALVAGVTWSLPTPMFLYPRTQRQSAWPCQSLGTPSQVCHEGTRTTRRAHERTQPSSQWPAGFFLIIDMLLTSHRFFFALFSPHSCNLRLWNVVDRWFKPCLLDIYVNIDLSIVGGFLVLGHPPSIARGAPKIWAQLCWACWHDFCVFPALVTSNRLPGAVFAYSSIVRPSRSPSRVFFYALIHLLRSSQVGWQWYWQLTCLHHL